MSKKYQVTFYEHIPITSREVEANSESEALSKAYKTLDRIEQDVVRSESVEEIDGEEENE